MSVSEFTKDEALAFIESMRLTLVNRVGFKWMVEKLTALAAYVESIAAENERLNAYIDGAGARGDYESHGAAHPDASGNGDVGGEQAAASMDKP